MKSEGKKEARYYQVKVQYFWGIVGVLLLLIIGVYHKQELYEKWLHSQEREEISFLGIKSKIENVEECYLCGDSENSMMGYYRKLDTIGLISLNDWYVMEFKLKEYDEEGEELPPGGSSSMNFGNTGEMLYRSDGSSSRGMASINVTLPKNSSLDTGVIENHLCQECLNKVLESLEYSRWKYERKEPIPLCLVDFKTLEIISLQEWLSASSIRDYWIEIEHSKNNGEKQVEVKAFYLPSVKDLSKNK